MKKFLMILWLCLPISVWAGEKAVYVFNWAEYMPTEILTQFENETKIKVVYSTYDNNESMYAKVKLLRGKTYDIVVPSTYYVHRMRKENLLLPIDKSKLSNFKYLDPNLLNKPYDPQNEFSVPYLWGSTAIGVNAEYIRPETIRSWKDLWNPDLKGKILLIDDIREVLGMGLKVLGYSCNDTDAGHLDQAYNKLKDLMPNVRLFAADSPKQPFLNLEVHAGMIWNGEAYMASKENPKITYIYPEEGSMLWLDSMVIPKGAKNTDHAHTFINFILRPDVAKRISEEIGYATPNTEAMKFMSPEVRENKTVYPDEATVQKAEFQIDIGDSIAVYEKIWEKLKAGH